MSAPAGWYPDPGGGQGLFRYWDGKAWSAATSPYPNAAPPAQSLVDAPVPDPSAGAAPQRQHPAFAESGPSAYARYQQATKKRSGTGWWIGAAALLVVVVIVAVVAIRSVTGATTIGTDPGVGQGTQNTCPDSETPSVPPPRPNDGRVHGGPVSYPVLGSPWSRPTYEHRVPFGRDVLSQVVTVESDYDGLGNSWVASVLVGELQAGDGFFTPEQGSQIVVRCILGKFYGLNPVNSNVTVNEGVSIDGHDGWLVESKLTFDIEGLQVKGELLIVAIVTTGSTAGLFYASIPDSRPELVQPAREALSNLQVDG